MYLACMIPISGLEVGSDLEIWRHSKVHFLEAGEVRK